LFVVHSSGPERPRHEETFRVARSLYVRNGVYILRKTIDGREYRRSTLFRDRKAAERRAAEIELEIRKEAMGWTPPPVVTFKHGSSGTDHPTV
jgi:hypothetical protein